MPYYTENYIPSFPAVQSFQGQQLDALIVYLLGDHVGLNMPQDLNTLMDSISCLKCFTETQLKQNLASALWVNYNNFETAEEIMAKISCLNCVDPQTIKTMIQALLVRGLILPPP